ncbi:MAG: hypothetical protein ABSB80_12730 [Methanoregula sp.]|jgi:hypothetical protein|uniref:hypothetical protein n=1 Tax=Methanoregula sp. TaxID=2052170 RepID=UPI003D0C298E
MAKALDIDIIATATDAIRKIDPSVPRDQLGKDPEIPGAQADLCPMRFYFCNFSHDFDFFIFSGNWAHNAARRHHPNRWYCHTPVRAFYDNYAKFLRSLLLYKQIFFRGDARIFRVLDQRSVSHIDHIVAIHVMSR